MHLFWKCILRPDMFTFQYFVPGNCEYAFTAVDIFLLGHVNFCIKSWLIHLMSQWAHLPCRDFLENSWISWIVRYFLLKDSESVCHSVVSDSLWLHALQPTRPLRPWNSLGKILEWVARPFSRGSSWPRDRTLVSCMAGRFFTIWTTFLLA